MSTLGAGSVPSGADIVGARAGAECDVDARPRAGAAGTRRAHVHAGISWSGAIGAAAVLALLATALMNLLAVPTQPRRQRRDGRGW